MATLCSRPPNTYSETDVRAGNLTLGAAGQNGIIRGELFISNGATVNANSTWGLGFDSSNSVNFIQITKGTLNFYGTPGSGGTVASSISMTGGAITGNSFDWLNSITSTPTLTTSASSTTAVISSGFKLRLGASQATFAIPAGTTPSGPTCSLAGRLAPMQLPASSKPEPEFLSSAPRIPTLARPLSRRVRSSCLEVSAAQSASTAARWAAMAPSPERSASIWEGTVVPWPERPGIAHHCK